MSESREFFFTNIGLTTLAGAINSVNQTAVSVADGSSLPDPNYGGISTLVLRDDANSKFEIVNLVDRSGNVCIVERGAEGTTKYTWPAGTIVRNALTAAFFEKLATPPESHFRTSKPYAYYHVDALSIDGSARKTYPWYTTLEEHALDIDGSVQEGELDDVLIGYADGAPEALDIDGSVQEGELDDVLIGYSDAAPEALDVDGSVRSGEIDEVLVVYNDAAVEALDINATPRSGALT